MKRNRMMINLLNKKGLTLVEVLVAMTVLLLVSLALLQTALVSIDSNMKNALRDEAVSIAGQRMTALRNTGFDDSLLDDCTNCSDAATITRELRNTQKVFSSNKTIRAIGTDNKELTITVSWQWKGKDYTHSTSTILRR